ncbi:MAG: hypothetical protein ACKORL_02805 [Phycisphaerales bacterium]
MKLILANPRGFCAGVYMAIDVVDQLLDICPDETIYVYHEIVHNRHVVDRFKSRGVRFIEELSEVPDGSLVVFSAHGVSPALRAEAAKRQLTAVDATCPLVTKVHNEAIRYAKAGYQILLVGLADWAQLAAWGPGPLVPGREMMDFDGDGALGTADAAAFWAAASVRTGDLDGNGFVDGLPFARPDDRDVLAFQGVLREAGVNTHIRASRGRDIKAACGQLRHESMKAAG